jgi:hypothetical protein
MITIEKEEIAKRVKGNKGARSRGIDGMMNLNYSQPLKDGTLI